MNKNVEKVLALFRSKGNKVFYLSSKRIAERNKVAFDDVVEAKKLYKLEKHPGLVEHCKEVGVDAAAVTSYWHKSKKYSMNVKPGQPDMELLKELILSEMKDYSPEYIPIDREPSIEPHLLVIDPADIHIGKLATSFETGESYDSQIAVKRVIEGVKGLIKKSSGYEINKVLLIIGNDILHIDSPSRTTSGGTPQDTDGMWYENFLLAQKLYVDIITMLTSIAEVHVVYNPSNHDYSHGFFLANTLKVWFKNNKDVTFDASLQHRKYFSYGKNLIGSTHGDGAKEIDLPLLMAQDAPKEWGMSKHRYIYTHHIHHKKSRDYGSVCVESLRSPSATDGWHHKKGYQHAPKAVEAFVHHPEHGQVARFTHIF